MKGVVSTGQGFPPKEAGSPGPAPTRTRRRSRRSVRKTHSSELAGQERESSDEEYGTAPRQFGLDWLGSYDSDEEYLDAYGTYVQYVSMPAP